MFLRRMGRKILLLESYRDGTGRVGQRRLGDFADVDEALGHLRDPNWRDEFGQRFSELGLDWERLIQRALELKATPVSRREARPRPQASKGSRRSIWHPDDPEAADQIRALRDTVEQLRNQARLEEACEAQARLTASFPGAEGWAAYGSLLQRLGRWDEALKQYSKLPLKQSLRHYQIASLMCAQGKQAESLPVLLRALTLDRGVAEGLVRIAKGFEPWKGADYWERYGEAWDQDGRKFFLAVYNQSLVKMALARAQRLGVKPRTLFREHALSVVLGQARDGVSYRKLPVY